MSNQIRIAILGDSISEGLGSKKYNYVSALQEELKECGIDAEIENFAHTGTTIDYALEIEESVKAFCPDFVLLFYGNVEAIIRPDLRKKSFATKILPQRYRKIFMLDPRPFYSKTKWKSIIQHLDTYFRFFMKRLIILTNGTYRMMEPNDFEIKYSQFVRDMITSGYRTLCVSNVRIDDKYFPKSSASLDEYRTIICRVAEKYNTSYIDLYNWQHKFVWKEIYGNDHYHPNLNGYSLMGKMFAKSIMEEFYKTESL